jgi:hypothetical protein
MTWTIREGPSSAPYEERDEIAWTWVIEREGEAKALRVAITGPAMSGPEENWREDVSEAKRTNGRSGVETILNEDDPPDRLTFTSAGLEAA